MVWLTDKERLTLTILGGVALVGLGITIWQQRRPPLRIEPGSLPPSAQWEAMLQAAKQIDLNRATASELERLPEIGPSLAQRIVEHRKTHGPFRTAEELQEVPGIGPKTYERLQEYVIVR